MRTTTHQHTDIARTHPPSADRYCDTTNHHGDSSSFDDVAIQAMKLSDKGGAQAHGWRRPLLRVVSQSVSMAIPYAWILVAFVIEESPLALTRSVPRHSAMLSVITSLLQLTGAVAVTSTWHSWESWLG